MATPPQVEVGARGTIASLMSQEIDYFRSRLNLVHNDFSQQKHNKATADTASTSGSCGNKSDGSSGKKKKKKKKKNKRVASGGGFLPSICSAVDVSDTSKGEKIPGNGYRKLRKDAKKLFED
ncbi:hypothetical protein C4D60_Mb04t39960 [Musa balbisiana]|uniref:Uncharacterized protein n=1 Tax=Musa balbisiana TaxID=52838 RepID=A0A4S8KI96_MUSBA|nr:hypothetical protein C4D60_Mb04t39960 [Musa balbisiana]